MRGIVVGGLLVFALQACAGANATRGGAPQPPLTAQQNLEVAAVLAQNGDTVRAEQYLHAALARGATAAEVYPRLLRMYVADGQFQLAADQTEAYLRRHPGDRTLGLFLATLYSALGYQSKAVEQYEKVLHLAPGDAHAHFALASALHDSGVEVARADVHYREYLKLEPRGPYAEEARSLLLTELP